MKKVLLTGATGFIGRHVTEELIKRGYTVYAPSTSLALRETEGLVQIRLDLFNYKAVDEFLAKNKFENIIHLAWYVGEKCLSADINLEWSEASFNILEKFKKYGGKKALFAGSMSEYDFSHEYLKEDSTPLNNPSLYGKCKASLYEKASNFAKQNDIDFKWARIFNTYGPYEKKSRLMPSVICSILNNEDIKLSTCLKTQDYLHVSDTASAIVDLFESEVQGAVNISSGIPVKLKSVVAKITELMEYDGEILYGVIPTTFDDNFVVGCNDKLINQVGWKQKIDLEEGLIQTIDWWRKNNVQQCLQR